MATPGGKTATGGPEAGGGLAADVAALPFEQALEQLERIVEELEDGSLPLEQALARFERGIQLSRHLEQQLAQAEARVQKLVGGVPGPGSSPALASPVQAADIEIEETTIFEAEAEAQPAEESDDDEGEDQDQTRRDRLF